MDASTIGVDAWTIGVDAWKNGQGGLCARNGDCGPAGLPCSLSIPDPRLNTPTRALIYFRSFSSGMPRLRWVQQQRRQPSAPEKVALRCSAHAGKVWHRCGLGVGGLRRMHLGVLSHTHLVPAARHPV
eukprot:362759-Chlamydomonas_euryale.AAC.2